VFTSANAVQFFFDQLKSQRSDNDSAILGLVTCAIGPATAKACLKVELEPDLVARESTSEGVLAAISEFVGGEDQLSGVRFLIPRARIARDLLPTELSRLGATVEAVETYQTTRPDTDCSHLIGLIEAGRVDVVTFTSPSTVSNFASLVGPKSFSKLLKETLVACIGPVTATAAAEHGFSNIVQADAFTVDSLVETIVTSMSERRRKK
jgi:uroporphyrinogen III methyltransferase/synthase